MAIGIDDWVRFCERTIDNTMTAVERLDERHLVTAPDLAGANTPYRLVTHSLAACRWWTEHMVAGHPSSRRRADEFTGAGTMADLRRDAEQTKARLRALAPELGAATELVAEPVTQIPLVGEWTVGAALMHAYEELAQHLGHLELTVDLLNASTEAP